MKDMFQSLNPFLLSSLGFATKEDMKQAILSILNTHWAHTCGEEKTEDVRMSRLLKKAWNFLVSWKLKKTKDFD